jgi:hypothetical protein
MPMKVSIDPVLASRIQKAWSQLDQVRPDLKSQILNGVQSAHLQAVQVAQTKTSPTVAAAPHTMMLAQSALTNDADNVINSLQAGVVIAVGPDGVIWGTGKWQQFDPGWIEAFAVFLESLLPFGGIHDFVKTPQTIMIPNKVQIALAGDWGTGEWRTQKNPSPSTRVRQQMIALNPDVTIHLGDVYYSGTEDEEQHLLTNLWPPAPSGSFSLNSNHEMYSGAKPYFAAISKVPFDKQRGCSYFALENDNWIIVGLDSAYYSPDGNLYMNGQLFIDGFPNEQNKFLQDKGERAQLDNKKVIVLTHHNGIDDPGANTNLLFEQVMNAFPGDNRPAYWYYGHQHIAAIYKPIGPKGVLCRCCGHGALPCGKASEMAGAANVVWHEARLANDPDIPERVLNGFAVLKLDGPDIQEVFYDENGGVAWSSS